MANPLKFNVRDSEWLADGERFPGGENVVEDPSAELLLLAGSAHHAGAIDVAEGLVDDHVEADDASVAVLTQAMGEWVGPKRDPETGVMLEPGRWTGPWYEGHAEQTAADEQHRQGGEQA
jgi:hypothetical protein